MAQTAETRIRNSMEALLARAGLDYRGGLTRVGSHSVHYLDYGPADPGSGAGRPPVLLLHGAAGGSAIWYRQIAALAAQRRVLVPDHPIFGLSSQPALKCTVREFAHDYVVGFLDALGIEQVDVAGLSLGGFAAIVLAIASPGRVRRVAVIAPPGLGRDIPWLFRAMSLPLFGRLLARPGKLLLERFFESHEVAHPERPDAPLMKQYAYEVTRANGHRAAMHSGVVTVVSLAGQKLLFSDGELSGIQAPMLVIWGAKDRFLPLSHAERAERLISDSRLEVLPDAGHVATFDEPERVSSLLTAFFGE